MPRKLKVVIAHHEKVIADTLCTILAQSNVDAAAAYTGVSGLERVLSTNPDAALLCIVPAYERDLNGVYAAVVVRALAPACRILLLPGGSGSWVTEPLAAAKAQGYEFELAAEPLHPNQLIRWLTPLTGGDIAPIGWKAPPQSAEGAETAQPRSALRRLFGRSAGSE